MPTGKTKQTTEPPVALATAVRFQPRRFVVDLADGRSVGIPLSFYPTLAKATPTQRRQWELLGDGRGICWESLDLDLSVQSLLAGAREGIPKPPPLFKLKSPRRKTA